MNLPLDNIGRWRCIGPFRGGRVVAVAGDPRDIGTFYFGACAGGVWKTDDAGQYWRNISDGYFNTASVGALAVSEADPNVIYAGTGEATIRIDVSHGDGVYKSTDAGRSWARIGLHDTRHIGKIRVHPQDPDRVFVAALGHAFGRNQQRGVFRSCDGGESWEQALFVSDKAGAVDLSIDVNNPRIIYATIWEAYRNFHMISSGGEDSGIWRSLDGGDTWENISGNKGLPRGIIGKAGIGASPAQAGRVYALIEHEEGGMYRSDDYGDSWRFVARNNDIISRAWYYMHLTPDPVDPDTVYVNNLRFWKSVDGGKTYSMIGTPHGDNHDLWIDPRNPKRMVQGNDGGACVSLNGGATWSSIFNQPTAQFYHVAADNREPYFVYGTQQDNSSIAVPSRNEKSSLMWMDGFIAGSGESGYIAVKPDDDDIIFVGAIGSSPGGGNCLQRYDHGSKQLRLVTTWPEMTSGEAAADLKHRFAWTYPIVFSPHDPNTLYIGGNQIMKSTDEGHSWVAISPDLTRADPATLQITGGPINRDGAGAEVYATVFALAESPHQPGVIWAGSDDGLAHISRDNGETWEDITPAALPEWSMISMLELSPHDPATCYLAAIRYKLDDYAPYLFKTSDYGQSWERINDGIREDDFTRVIRCDPARPGLLYAGTETGLYVSFDDGASWGRFQLNLPVTPIHDLLVKNGDLIAATHGRSFWILDDLTRLHQLSGDLENRSALLLKPRATQRILESIDARRLVDQPGKTYQSSTGVMAAYTHTVSPENVLEREFLDSGENLPRGVLITYYLGAAPAGKITLRIADAEGETLCEFHSMDDVERQKQKDKPDKSIIYLMARAGWNRFVWDMRLPTSPKLNGKDPQFERMPGPTVTPGRYTINFQVGDEVQTQRLNLIPDASSSASGEDSKQQFDLLLDIYRTYSAATETLNRMRRQREQLKSLAERLGETDEQRDLAQQATALRGRILDIEKGIFIPELREGWAGRLNQGTDPLRRLSALPSVVGLGEFPPTVQSYAVYEKLAGMIRERMRAFEDLRASEIAEFNQLLVETGITLVG
ncbi:MAG: glycosyl hydrolase [Chloroflexota bacterium]|nr:glycosyl hydrolase [Chloroflexota bacterium]MDE2946611.1 glycosyl hydrolase [Chloroflexota bacterium]